MINSRPIGVETILLVDSLGAPMLFIAHGHVYRALGLVFLLVHWSQENSHKKRVAGISRSLGELRWSNHALNALKAIFRACRSGLASSPHYRLSNGLSASLEYGPLAAEQIY